MSPSLLVLVAGQPPVKVAASGKARALIGWQLSRNALVNSLRRQNAGAVQRLRKG